MAVGSAWHLVCGERTFRMLMVQAFSHLGFGSLGFSSLGFRGLGV